MLTSVLVGAAVFAAQVGAYAVVTRYIRQRAAYRARLAGIRSREYAAPVAPARNRVGEN